MSEVKFTIRLYLIMKTLTGAQIILSRQEEVFDAAGREVTRLFNNEFSHTNSYTVSVQRFEFFIGSYSYSPDADSFIDTKK